ncbi:MAG TPA: hypothetical protein ENH41_02170 [Candidatus Omnitrophica bacterium]|nr:hypothetical protein [Candidatus Omnitrophota bacterium]
MQKKGIFLNFLVKLFTVIIFTICSLLFLTVNISLGQEDVKLSGVHKYISEFKTNEEEYGLLNQPAGLRIDADGDIYVADTINSRVVVFNSFGGVKAVFGKAGDKDGELKAPMALAIDSKNEKVYVADSSNYRIQVFKLGGEFLSSIDLNKGIEEGVKKVRPIGIAVSSNGNIYVSDADNNYIRIYSPSGEFISKFGGFGAEDGKFCIPVGLFIDKKDKVYAVDMNNSRVQIFDNQGKFIFKIGQLGDTKGNFGKPKDVAVDEKGFIYISDGANLVVQIFDKKGNLVDLVGAEKEADLQFASPFGLAAHKGRLYVTDRWRNSIRVYEVKF